MMMQSRIIILLLALTGFSGYSNHLQAQEALIPGPFPAGSLPVERILLQTDRDMYMCGENIWFTATCSLTHAGAMQQMSRVLYVELFNSQREVLLREKFSISDRAASGCLTIPWETGTDAYLLRAYTRYQRNFPPESYAMRSLTIINPDIPYLHRVAESDKIIIIPEGGNLVSGYPARLAIRVNPDKTGAVRNAQLIDQHERLIAEVKMSPNGLGVCEFTPVDSLRYVLRIIPEQGDPFTEALPPIENPGFIPSLRRTPEGMAYHADGKLPESDYRSDSLILCVKSADMITLEELRVKRPQMPLHMIIPYPGSYKGMIYLVLKEKTGDILHVLPACIPPETRTLAIATDRSTFSCRDKVDVHINAPIMTDETIRFSVSVIKQGLDQLCGSALDETFIRNPFLIHSLTYQGVEWADEMTEQADLCMILYTPHVNTILFGSKITESDHGGLNFLPDIRDVSLSGQVISKNTKEGVAGVQVILSVLEQSQFHMAKSDSLGRFVFPLNNLTGEQQIFLSPQAGNGQNNEILVQQDFSNQFPDHLDLVPVLDSSIRELIGETWINAQVMVLHPPFEPVIAPEPAPGVLFAEDRLKVVLSDYIEMANLYEVFWEIVPFVQIRKKKDHYFAQITNDRTEVYDDPLILLDNVPVRSVDDLLEIPTALVDRVEVINRPYIHGDFVLNGVLMVYTNTENFAGSTFPPGSVFLDYQTITSSLPFPLYDYSAEEQKTSRLPNFRNVLYWDPGLVPKENSATFSFYTSDHCGDYDIIIRGIGTDGQSYSGRIMIQVSAESH